MKRCLFPIILFALLSGGRARGQLAGEFKPPRANCCLVNSAKSLADQLQDWNQLGRYHQANQELQKQPGDAKRVVFLGDSITDIWKLEEYFPDKPYVNRGISGQTTPQMLVRLYPDVIDLKPAAMILLAGTNDVARNTGPSTAEMIEENMMAMTELAQLHGIKVIWMKSYAARVNAIYADYFTALVDERGWLKDAYSMDGLHPNVEGYKVMAPIAAGAIQKALQ